jgi:universal stress protein A
MSSYQRILCAVDLTADSRAVLARAAELAGQWRSALRLVHIVEFVPIESMSDSLTPVVQIDDRVIERAGQQLRQLATEAGLDGDCALAIGGNVKAEVLRQARDWHADLIVLGSRERHGLSILVNLVEDTLLHSSPCDVLAVRVR